jgi:hypothetical protein
MYYSYVEIEYVATSFSPARTDLALKLLTSKKKIQFQPSTHIINEASFVKIVSKSWQAEVIARSTSYQTPWTDKNLARNRSATKLVFKWTVMTVHST